MGATQPRRALTGRRRRNPARRKLLRPAPAAPAGRRRTSPGGEAAPKGVDPRPRPAPGATEKGVGHAAVAGLSPDEVRAAGRAGADRHRAAAARRPPDRLPPPPAGGG